MAIFFRPIPIGSVVSFRYLSPTARDRAPMVFVITSNYNQKLHGIQLRYLPYELMLQLQWIFKPLHAQQTQVNPFAQESMQDARKREEIEKRKKDFLEKQQGVIVKPDSQSPFGVSTFGPTRKQVQPSQGMDVDKPDEPPRIPPEEMERQRQIRELTERIKRNRQVLSNPYNFYHQYIKPLIGPNSYEIAKVYRTYRHGFINNLRIVHSSNIMGMR